METIPAVKFRKNLGEFLDRAKLKGETFIIERDGKPVAAVVSLADLEAIKKEAAQDVKALFVKWSKQKPNANMTDDEVDQLVVQETTRMREFSKK